MLSLTAAWTSITSGSGLDYGSHETRHGQQQAELKKKVSSWSFLTVFIGWVLQQQWGHFSAELHVSGYM